MTFPWSAYAERTGLDRTPFVDEPGLFAVHHAQFHAIAFENLDIQLGREIGLEPETLLDKLVSHRRGGYCFELNGLLLLALRHLGFEARPLLARVHLQQPPSGRTHQLNEVRLDGRTWVVDAGFGASGPRQPLLLEDGFEASGEHWGYRIDRRPPWGWMMSTREGRDAPYRESYSFEQSHVTPADIAVSNFFTSHSPLTHFTRCRIASRPTPDGRISLRDQELTRLAAGVASVETVAGGPATMELLEREFGLVVDARFEDFRPLP